MPNITSVIAGISRIVGSALGKRGAVLFDLGGYGLSGDPNAAGSQNRDLQESYAASGIYARPPDDETEPSEAVHVNLGDEKVTVAVIDRDSLELANKGTSAPSMPAKGQRLVVGYGGAFVSFQRQDDKTDLFEVCVGYERNGSGVPTKMHSFVMDPGTGAISLVQGDGSAIQMSEDGITLRADATTYLSVKPGGDVLIMGANIKIVGNVALGPGALTGSPAGNLQAAGFPVPPAGPFPVPSTSVTIGL